MRERGCAEQPPDDGPRGDELCKKNEKSEKHEPDEQSVRSETDEKHEMNLEDTPTTHRDEEGESHRPQELSDMGEALLLCVEEARQEEHADLMLQRTDMSELTDMSEEVDQLQS